MTGNDSYNKWGVILILGLFIMGTILVLGSLYFKNSEQPEYISDYDCRIEGTKIWFTDPAFVSSRGIVVAELYSGGNNPASVRLNGGDWIVVSKDINVIDGSPIDIVTEFIVPFTCDGVLVDVKRKRVSQ